MAKRLLLLAACLAVFIAAPAQAATPIAVVDRSDSLGYREIVHTTAAVNAQMRTVKPVWGEGDRVQYVRYRSPLNVPFGWWVVEVQDSYGLSGVLGYHTTLSSNGQPVGYIFAKDSAVYHFAWSTVLSHEVLEMSVNPHLDNRFYDPVLDAMVDREIADLVQNDEYAIGDVKVSNWSFPAAFDRSAGCPCDYMNLSTHPMEVRPGGYMPIFESKGRSVFHAPR